MDGNTRRKCRRRDLFTQRGNSILRNAMYCLPRNANDDCLQEPRRVCDRRRIEAVQATESGARLAAECRITMHKIFERWVSIELTPRIAADGRRLARKDGGAFTTHAQLERRILPRRGEPAAEDVRRGDLLALLDAVKADGKVRTANVPPTDLNPILRFALTCDIVQRNPLDTVTKRDVGCTPAERERVLSADEVRMLATILPVSGLRGRFVCAVWLILSTGVRVGELLGATWADSSRSHAELRATANACNVKLGFVDLERRTWHLPEAKNQRDHTVHLSAFALEQFRQLLALCESEPDALGRPVSWVIPNLAATGPVGVKSLGKQLSDRQREPTRRLRGRTKATSALVLPAGRWTAHDLRRPAATLMPSLGISGDVIDECLNHMIESRVRRTCIRDRRGAAQVKAFDALWSHRLALASPPAALSPDAPRREAGRMHNVHTSAKVIS